MAKTVKIDGISYNVTEEGDSLVFRPASKDDRAEMHKSNANTVSAAIGKHLDRMFFRGAYFYKAGKDMDNGLYFRQQSPLNRL